VISRSHSFMVDVVIIGGKGGATGAGRIALVCTVHILGYIILYRYNNVL